MKRLFPLKYYLLTLSISLVLIVGGSIGSTSHVTMKKILDSSTSTTSQSIRKELSATLQAQNDRAISVISLLSHYPALFNKTLEQRGQVIPVFADVLRDMSNIVTLYVCDSDGHCLFLRKFVTQSDYQHFDAPKHTEFLLEEIGDGVALHTLLDKDLHEISAYIDPKTSSYDPRTRPWYKKAKTSKDIVKTPVYDFFTIKEKGYTISKRLQLKDKENNTQTIILSADIRVGYLEKILR